MACKHPKLTPTQTDALAQVWSAHVKAIRADDSVTDDELAAAYMIRDVLAAAPDDNAGPWPELKQTPSTKKAGKVKKSADAAPSSTEPQ